MANAIQTLCLLLTLAGQLGGTVAPTTSYERSLARASQK